MTTKATVEDFVRQRALAVVGVSRSGKKFGNTICRDLQAKGYRLFPVHPGVDVIDGERCYRDFSSLPESVGGVIVVVPPAQAERVVEQAVAAGIRRVWLQQGAGSPSAISFCERNGVAVVSGHCILMFAEPIGFGHKMHRWVWGLIGKLPKEDGVTC